MPSVPRPFGVTLLSVLYGVGGLIWLLLGLLMFAGGGLLTFIGAAGMHMHALLAGFLFAMGVAFAIIGLVDFLLAYGLYAGKWWAWGLAVAFAILSLVFSILMLFTGIGIIRLLIDIVIIYYLTRARVRAYFQRGS